MTATEFDRLRGTEQHLTVNQSGIAARKYIEELSEKWLPILGLRGWNIAFEIGRQDDMDGKDTLGQCNACEYSKWATVKMLHPIDWNHKDIHRDRSFELVFVHELIHLFFRDCRVKVDAEDEELLVSRLADIIAILGA